MVQRRANVHGGAAQRARAAARRLASASGVSGLGREERTFALNPKQHDFVFSASRFAFYVGGIGSGKTFGGSLRAILRTQEYPGSLGLVGAPTYPMLRDASQRMFFSLCPDVLIERHVATENRTVMRNGSEILWRSLDDPDRVRGLNLAWFWLDEAPLCGYYSWKVLKGRLRQEGFAAGVEDGTAGWATGTPRGRDGFARDFELEPRDGHALYRASTRENARNLPAEFIADLGYSGAYALQELEGLFVAFDGLVYRFEADSVDGHVRAWPRALNDFRRVVGGIDWGYTNPAAAVVFGLDGDRRAWQLTEFYERRASLTERIVPRIVELTRGYGVDVWWCDSEDPEAIATLNGAFGREGLQTRARPVKKGPGSVRAGIQTVTGLLAMRGDGTRGLYVDPGCIHTIAEYGSYQYADRGFGEGGGGGGVGGGGMGTERDTREEPVKQGDHAMSATRYVLHSELGAGGAAATDAYLAALLQRVGSAAASEDRDG
jgi:phage terminase large subunit-like protein